MKLKIKQDFAFAHRGVDVRHYEAGQEIESDDADLIEVAIREGWAVNSVQPEGKARKGAPENKSTGGV
jgi:hypothetical protein